MINDAWDWDVNQNYVNLTYRKTSETCLIPLANIKDITEETLQGLHWNMLTDKDVMLGLGILIRVDNHKLKL